MKLLITGGLGNLGLWLTHYFLENGHFVTVISRSEKVLINHVNYNFLNCDITSQNELNCVIDQYYDCCIHAASYNEHFEAGYSEKALLINSIGTDNLCRALLQKGVGKLVYLSTFHVYGLSSGIITEKTSISPLNDYGLTHFFAEKYIEKHSKNNDLSYCILRLTNSYGCPKDINTDKWYLIFNDLCKQAFSANRIQLKTNGKAVRDFIWMGDVVRIIDLIILNSKCNHDVFNLSSGYSFDMLQIAKYVSNAFYDLYDINIPISLNENDFTSSNSLSVSNQKLNEHLYYQTTDVFVDEAKKVFDLLSRLK